jgi:hypothetical protein
LIFRKSIHPDTNVATTLAEPVEASIRIIDFSSCKQYSWKKRLYFCNSITFEQTNNKKIMKIMNPKKFTFLFVLGVLALIFFSGCAKKEVIDACLQGHQYGFLGGLWHGIIAPVDFFAMLIDGDKYTLYAQNNNGAWYAFGFLLGSGGWGFIGGRGIARKRR